MPVRVLETWIDPQIDKAWKGKAGLSVKAGTTFRVNRLVNLRVCFCHKMQLLVNTTIFF